MKGFIIDHVRFERESNSKAERRYVQKRNRPQVDHNQLTIPERDRFGGPRGDLEILHYIWHELLTVHQSRGLWLRRTVPGADH